MPDSCENKSTNDIFLKLGEMSGTLETFIKTQEKYNDVLFETQRSHATGIESLLQTRRAQWKVIGLLGTFSATIAAFAHKIFPTIPPQ